MPERTWLAQPTFLDYQVEEAASWFAEPGDLRFRPVLEDPLSHFNGYGVDRRVIGIQFSFGVAKPKRRARLVLFDALLAAGTIQDEDTLMAGRLMVDCRK